MGDVAEVSWGQWFLPDERSGRLRDEKGVP